MGFAWIPNRIAKTIAHFGRQVRGAKIHPPNSLKHLNIVEFNLDALCAHVIFIVTKRFQPDIFIDGFANRSCRFVFARSRVCKWWMRSHTMYACEMQESSRMEPASSGFRILSLCCFFASPNSVLACVIGINPIGILLVTQFCGDARTQAIKSYVLVGISTNTWRGERAREMPLGFEQHM